MDMAAEVLDKPAVNGKILFLPRLRSGSTSSDRLHCKEAGSTKFVSCRAMAW